MNSEILTRSVGFLAAICLFMTLAGASTAPDGFADGFFTATLSAGDDSNLITGESTYHISASSISIYMRSENGRCGIHFVNFKKPPGIGTHVVGAGLDMNTGIVCVLDNLDQQERLASESGTITLSARLARSMTGTFDVVMVGGVTGKKYRLTGEFRSVE